MICEKDKTATAIIQARMGATRLPGKVLLKVLDKTILEYVIERVSKAESVDRIIVATTISRQDLDIVKLASTIGVSVFCGSESDVLDRYYQTARLFEAEHIIRITSDCPLIDPGIIDMVVNHYFETGAQYCSNVLKETFPDGLDVEVFDFKSLKRSWEKAELLSEREHVTSYIRKNPEVFKLKNVESTNDYSGKRWTLDCPEDYSFIKSVIENLYPVNPNFNFSDILNFLDNNADIEQYNKDIIRNEGYIKSLANDKNLRGELS
ncbi:MAG: glycosyltransferase family protein [Candidatus Omnitrophota bacterium]